ncbi:PCD20 protein, partial [Amia calva]|nr:PCD20 protein [Amia calva]
ILLLTQTGYSRSAPEVSLSVREQHGAGVWIGSIGQKPPSGPVTSYQLLTTDERVRLDGQTGDLFTTGHAIDREAQCPAELQAGPCLLQLSALVNPDAEVINVRLVIEDINDNTPSFQVSNITLHLLEDVPVGTRLELDLHVSDLDTGSNGAVKYRLEGGAGFFSVEPMGPAPVVVVGRQLDRETQETHHMMLSAVDQGDPPLTGTVALLVQVMDVNDNCPAFPRASTHTISVPADTPIGTVLTRIHATDADLGPNTEVTYSFSPQVSQGDQALFHLDSRSGEITLSASFCSDSPTKHLLKIWASDLLSPCPPAVTNVTVSVLPVPGQEQVMDLKYIAKVHDQTLMLREDEPVGTTLAILEVRNPGAIRAQPSIQGDMPFVLKLHQGKYVLVTSDSLDFERQRQYDVLIVASDAKDASIQHKKLIHIQVEDMNDNAPQFHQSLFHVDIEENNQPGVFLMWLSATDADSQQNGQVLYSLGSDTPPTFSIDSGTGLLSVVSVLDRETKEYYNLTVLARDLGEPALESSATVAVRVLDQNDNSPAFLTSEFIFFIPENFPQFGNVGVINVSDADSGDNGLVKVRLLNVSSPFTMDNTLGILKCTAPVDRETQDRHELWIEARDQGRPVRSINARVTVFILDVNDNAPKVLLPITNHSCLTVLPSTVPGTTVARVLAVDEDAGLNSIIHYQVKPCGTVNTSPFVIDSASGNITLAHQLLAEHHKLHQLYVTVSDSGSPRPLQATVWVHLWINATAGPCRVSTLPPCMPDPYPVPQGTCAGRDPQESKNSQMVFILGLSMMLTSMVFLTAGICTFLLLGCRDRKTKIKTNCKETEIPLKLIEAYDMKDWPDVQ